MQIRKGDTKAQNYLLEKYKYLVNMKANKLILSVSGIMKGAVSFGLIITLKTDNFYYKEIK